MNCDAISRQEQQAKWEEEGGKKPMRKIAIFSHIMLVKSTEKLNN